MIFESIHSVVENISRPTWTTDYLMYNADLELEILYIKIYFMLPVCMTVLFIDIRFE